MHVLAVRIGRGQDRAEEAVEGRELAGHGRDEGQVLLGVVADREGVVGAGAQEAVHAAAVELLAAALPGVVGVGVGAALEIRREPVGVMHATLPVGVDEPVLATVGPGQPAEVVVEGAVLHHQHDEGVDRQVARCRHRLARPPGRLGEDRLGAERRDEAGGEAAAHRGTLKELPAAKERAGSAALDLLGYLGIALVVGIRVCDHAPWPGIRN